VGNGASFNGSNEYLSRADNAALSAGDTTWSLNVWVNAVNYTINNNVVVSKTGGTGASDEEYILRYLNVVSGWDFSIQTGTTYVAVRPAGAPSTGLWYMLSIGHNASLNELWFAINAGTPAVTSHAGGVNDAGGEFNIGRYAGAGVQYWDGLIDQIGFWRRDIRADVSTLYNAGAGLSYAAMGGGSPPSGGHDLPLLGVGKGLLPFWPAWWRYQRMQEKRIRQAERDCLRRHAA
jgi:hypothetical protein